MIYTYYIVFTVYVDMNPIYKNWAVMTYGKKIEDNHDIRVVIKWLEDTFESDITDQLYPLGLNRRTSMVVLIPETVNLLNEKEALPGAQLI